MDGKYKNPIIHLESLPRANGAKPTVNRVGFHAHKRHSIRRTFDQVSLSLITAGWGWSHHRGERWKVEASMAMLHRPGEHHFYGPQGEWSEAFVVFTDPWDELVDRLGLGREVKGFQEISPGREVMDLLHLILHGAVRSDQEGQVDVVDRLAEALLIQVMQEPTKKKDQQQAIVALALAWRLDPVERRSMGEVADTLGFSEVHFRRLWKARFGVAPLEWLMERRMERAMELLDGGELKVADVARAIGYDDVSLFSNTFRRRKGLTPGQWKRAKRMV